MIEEKSVEHFERTSPRDGAPVVEVRGLTKRYPGVIALDAVDMQFRRGEIHVLLGENGAGKSTLLRMLGGVERPSRGEILIDGKLSELDSPRSASTQGISLVHQELSMVPQLTLAENVALGREHSRLSIRDKRADRAAARKHLAMLGWTGDIDQVTSSCSVATQQAAEIARALLGDQRVIVLDEPTASLAHTEVQNLLRILHKLRSQGKAIIYVSHRLAEIDQLSADRVSVLRDGRVSGRFRRDDGWSEDDLVRAMVGRSVEIVPVQPRDLGEPALRLRELKVTHDAPPVSLDVRAGEIVVLAGMVGSGRTELLRAVFGADPPASGHVEVLGSRVRYRRPSQAIADRIAFLTEDRKNQGLALNMSIASNVTLTDPPRRLGVIRRRAQRRVAMRGTQEMGLERPVRASVSVLSGGNQQKIVIARWQTERSRIFLFDEPTRGIDVGAKQDVYELIEQLAKSGVAVLVVSSDLPEVLALGDRVLVMRDGALVSGYARETVTEEVVIRDATRSSQ